MLKLGILWLLFFASHSILAAEGVKQLAAKLLGSGYKWYRIFYNVVSTAFLLAILYVLAAQHEYSYVFTQNTITNFSGYAFTAAGLIVLLSAFRQYDLGEFSGVKQLRKTIEYPEQLVISGINRYVRHPLYSGILLLLIGLLLLLPTYMMLMSGIITAVYIYIGSRLEEKKLLNAYGKAYADYMQQVRMFIPYVF